MSRSNTSRELRVRMRRQWLREAVGAMALSVFAGTGPLAAKEPGPAAESTGGHGRFKHSVCYWCFEKLGLEPLAIQAAAMGIQSIELVKPEQWPILKRHGLICAMTASHSFLEGWSHPEHHAQCAAQIKEAVDVTAAAGFPAVITFSGLRKGMPDYLCDKVEWAVEVCRRIGSERMKILFDIFHVQIMQGDLITRIKHFHPYIGHYHTAGVPGRHEIDETQEINYSAVMRAISDTGFTGFVAQEFLPTREPLQSLREAVKLCEQGNGK